MLWGLIQSHLRRVPRVRRIRQNYIIHHRKVDEGFLETSEIASEFVHFVISPLRRHHDEDHSEVLFIRLMREIVPFSSNPISVSADSSFRANVRFFILVLSSF